LVGLSAGDDAVDDACNFVCRGGQTGGFTKAAFHASTVFSHFAFGFFEAECGKSQRFCDAVFDFAGMTVEHFAAADGIAGTES